MSWNVKLEPFASSILALPLGKMRNVVGFLTSGESMLGTRQAVGDYCDDILAKAGDQGKRMGKLKSFANQNKGTEELFRIS